MKKYSNLNGDSGIRSYQTGPDFIVVEFTDGNRYRYTYKTPGKVAVEQMKKCAQQGKGLCTYINQHVRDKYEEKL